MEPEFTEAFADRYLVKELLGEGGMGVVHHAIDSTTGESVALKILRPSVAKDDKVVKRFVQEAEAARRVVHPNVVRYRESGLWRQAHYAVMELVDGPTLREHVEANGRMDPTVALLLMAQAARGLAAIHAAGVVHRDVKPANLLLVGPDTPPSCIKIGDFGLAKLDHNPVTGSLLAIGTVDFMSPEQALADTADARSDVYALGIVTFFVLTGELPYIGKNAPTSMAHQLLSTPPPPSWLVEELDPAIDDLVAVALRKSPDRRFQTMDAFCRACEVILGKPGPEPEVPKLDGPDEYQPQTEQAKLIFGALKNELATGK
ncbi:MAG: serine/threonine protein kinase [Myxococcales bacterium]|nr:serine/threonine protein kinase [Myxococcales bacterium]